MASNFSYVFDASSTEIVYNRKCREQQQASEQAKKRAKVINEATAPPVPQPVTLIGKAEFRSPNPDEIILYFYPYSFYSQVVLLAMYQRQISFTAFILDIHSGDQFREEYLRLNPRGEVPVLSDGISQKVIIDAALILRHIESNLVEAHGPSLLPLEPSQRRRAEELAGKLHRLKVEALTFGSVIHNDPDVEPRGIFADQSKREGIREYIRKRRAIYRTEILNFPEYANALNKKLVDIQKDWHFLERRQDYDELVRSFDRLLDECEEEIASRLHHKGFLASHRNTSSGDRHQPHLAAVHPDEHPDEFMDLQPSQNNTTGSQNRNNDANKNWWLCSPEISIADIFLAIVLWRMNEIGYGRRIFGSRHNLLAYYERMKKLEAFQRATDPNFLDAKGTDVEAESVIVTEPEPLLCPYNSQREFPWWIVALPLGTIIIYGIWGWIEGPPRPPTAASQRQLMLATTLTSATKKL